MYRFTKLKMRAFFEGLNWDLRFLKQKSGFCVWCDRTTRGLPTYLNFIENQVSVVLTYQGVI